jgi:hypothetical protein
VAEQPWSANVPSDVKAIVSAVTLLVAIGFAFWEKGNGRQDLFWLVLGFGVFAVVAMWIFPEAQGSKSQGANSEKSKS